MRQAIIKEDLSVSFEPDAAIPEPREDEVIICAVYAGINPIDWKGAREADSVALHGELKNPVHRAAGKDFAGYVHAVGPNVHNFRVGDRVTAVNHSSGFAEYSVGPVYTTALLPPHVSFVEASTFGLAYITAALGVFKNRPLPTPWNPAPRDAKHPIVVYGASSAVGAFAVKLASLANLHPIIAIAGQSGDVVKSILDPKKGDMFLDYRQGPEKLIQRIRSTPEDIHFAFDAICGEGTSELLCQVLHPENSYLGRSLHLEESETKIPQNIGCQVAFAPGLWEPNDPDGPDGENSPNVGPRAFATVAFAYLTFALENELIQGHPYEVLSNGLEGLSDALKALKAGKNKGVKYVCEIAATPGFLDV
ncbi:hypothetical protein VE00_10982 [Pseudogymnoascus sp. WSF 3629]|nr:hypothetical protein VE00_10982 [Pseudogymnoascus sp. WSF 3629]